MRPKMLISNLSMIYETEERKVFALDKINFKVDKNEFLCIVGPSGCGKTTLLYIIAGLLRPVNGSVKIDGHVVTEPGAERAVVFQADATFPHLSVYENIAYGPKVKGMTKKEIQPIVERYINLVGLRGFEKNFPRELSGGMKKRVDVARAFANNPEILLMDEPFGMLDVLTKEKLQLEILRIWDVEKKTIVFVTHDLEEALFMSDRTIVMSTSPGKIQEVVKISFSRPREVDLRTDPEFQKLRRRLSHILNKPK